MPEAHSSALFGPGDAEPANAKATTASRSVTMLWERDRSDGVLYVLVIVGEQREWVRAWRPGVPGIREVFHARFLEHAYPAHTHDTWTVFIVDEGAIRYDLEASHRGVAGSRVTLLPPHLVHDGRAATTTGYRKRVLYVDPDLLDERLIGPAVDRPDIEDPSVVRRMRSLHALLAGRADHLEVESMVATAFEPILLHLGASAPVADRPEAGLADEFRAYLDAHRFEPVTLADAGLVLHASPSHLIRSFTRAFGIAPHRYLTAKRIDAARSRLLEGEPIASVATEVGFHDQPHLTRQFRKHVGTTPARYAASTRSRRRPV
jgi:AraC-like DNA-binding protein